MRMYACSTVVVTVDLRWRRHHARRSVEDHHRLTPWWNATTRRSARIKDEVVATWVLRTLIDVRRPQEYTGERTHMPDYPEEGALRGGHIPTRGVGAVGQGRRRSRPVPAPRRI